MHLLHEERGILNSRFQWNLMPLDGQQIPCPAARTLERLVGLIEVGGALKGLTLLTFASVGKAIRVNLASKLSIAIGKRREIQFELGLQLEQCKMTGSTHGVLRY
ncbi:hypothetical protein F753_19575 [Stutzerimonas chloritidismutans AW-1]|uniref:Uncharacterized protein n=1 Tax=Stutzerimonas chloritidismutans AW-1 TaxID=1263865 RepID=V4Q7Q6_STUCH|nr:hypothetical protein F753_19575 [Stutzerimonas chloritidismutans AW-1]